MLVVDNVTVKYGDFTAIKDLNFQVGKGEMIGLLGKNGSGKTTTFRTILGLLLPTQGKVLFNGKPIDYDIANEIGYMIEERSLLLKLKVSELMHFYGGIKCVSKEEVETRLDYWLNRFQITEYKNKKIKELSKGNQQKIQFIASVINNPSLLILDEPFSGLDIINAKEILNSIEDFRAKGTIVVFSSHQIDQVQDFCKQVIIIDKGNCVLSGNISEIQKDFKKQVISIQADGVDVSKISQIEGVSDVAIQDKVVKVTINDDETIDRVFQVVKDLKNVRQFVAHYASLSEIFIAKVGNK